MGGSRKEAHVHLWLIGEGPLEKEMPTHFRVLAWKIPWTEDPGRLQSMGSQRVRHDLATKQQPQWQIHGVIQQKPSQHCKAIILKLIFFNEIYLVKKNLQW